MIEDLNPVDTLLSEIQGNTRFLERLLFPNIKLVFVAVLFGAIVVISVLIG